MSGMVERVAEELHARTPLDSRWSLIDASAAIAAMREPTEGMVDAGRGQTDFAEECFTTMIDAALKEIK